MRFPVLLTALLASFALAAPAAPPPKPKGKPKGKPKPPVEKPTGHSALYDHVMKKYDVNRNKKFDEDERIEMRKAHDANDFMVSKLDSNGNNVLDAAEIAAIENEKAAEVAPRAKPAAPKKKKKKKKK